MTSIPGTSYVVSLADGERLFAAAPADGFFASDNVGTVVKPFVILTDQRFVIMTVRGMMGKRLDEVASWPLTSFTSRLNSSEGSALGSFMYLITLFCHNGVTVSTGFKRARDAESFKSLVVDALGPVLG